jgi:hypothetical protein
MFSNLKIRQNGAIQAQQKNKLKPEQNETLFMFFKHKYTN